MNRLLVSLTNETEGHVFSEWVEALEGWLLKDDGTPDLGHLFKVCQAEYGVCRSSVYVDPAAGGPPRKVGWYFESRQRYEDTGQPYLRGAWVSVAREQVES